MLTQRTLNFNGVLLRNTRFFNFFCSGNTRFFSNTLLFSFFNRHFRLLFSALLGNFTFLHQSGEFTLLINFQRTLFGFQVLTANLDRCILLDIVTLFLTSLNLLSQLSQTFGVECVGWVEDFQSSLVKIGQTNRFDLKAGFCQGLSDNRFNGLDIVTTMLLDFFHIHLRSHHTQGVNETTLYQVAQAFLIHGALTQRTGSNRYRFLIRRNAHVEFGHQLDTHSVFGNKGLVTTALHFDTQGSHTNRCDVVNDRQYKRTTTENNLFTAQTCSDERDLFR
ncbi:hypothetical protein imdm_2279 [gamma proteobacterium IMCC2047]|nr:hypothetical protein imdm_2279 [gamma proteobacterium IMCC2047]